MKKYSHVLRINNLSSDSKEYTYSFGSTKEINLVISKDGILISAFLTRKYTKNEILSNDCKLFSDAIKKALLIYLIKFNQSLKIESITIKIDDSEDILIKDTDSNPVIYSLINGQLTRNLPLKLSDDKVIYHLLRTTKSKYDRRIASLFSLLCSKSKSYEIERFIYLWTCFNGMYGWISEYIASANGKDKYRKENIQILGFQNFIEVGNETILEEDKNRIANEVVALLKDISPENICRNVIESSEINNRIDNVLYKSKGGKYNLTSYGYLLTQLSYYFRCNIIHGKRPLFLFSFTDEKEIRVLKIINGLLEEFVDEYFPLWFDPEYVNTVIIPKVITIKLK